MSVKPFPDNNYSEVLLQEEARALLPHSGIGLDELCAANPSLLLFPDCLGDNGDKITEPLYSLEGNERSGYRLWTGNIVGFWGVNGVNVRVHSRFDDEKHQYFFHYMLQRIAGFNVLDFKTLPDQEDLWDFLIYLFPMALKRAVRQGVFRAYRIFMYDDDRIKGSVDIPRLIRRDIPFAGRISYNTREHTGDNHVMQLIRHTVEYIRKKAPVLLTADAEMRRAVDLTVQMTPDFTERDRTRVISANLRPVRHPFYSDYTTLQKLCLQILRHEKLSYGNNDGSISGIVFDAAWLWEEYLNAIFQSNSNLNGIVHPRNKMRTDPVYFYKNRGKPHYPDFYDEKRHLILDAKYKRMEGGVASDDLVQMISYIHILGCDGAILMKPNESTTRYQEDGTLNTEKCETIGVITLRIPHVGEDGKFENFVKEIAGEEKILLDILTEKFKCS